MTPLQAIAVGVAGAWLVCAVLLARSGVRVAAVLLAVAAVLFGVQQALEGAPAVSIEIVLWMVGWPLAILAYPMAGRRGPDLVAGGAVLVAGATALLVPAGSGLIPAGAIIVLALLAHLWWRFERSSPAERVPLIWLVIGLAVPALAGFATAFVAPESDPLVLVTEVTFALPAVGMVVGVRPTGAVDVRGIVVEAAVLGVAAGTCFALYSTAANGLLLATGAVPDIGIQGILAAGVALAFQPLRRVLRSTLDELLFGRRPDPIAAAVEVAGGPLSDPTAVLERIREAMVLPYAALRVGPVIDASSGEPTPSLRSFPLGPAATPSELGDPPADPPCAAPA